MKKFLAVLLTSAVFFQCKRESCELKSTQSGLIGTIVNVASCFPDLDKSKQWVIETKGEFDSLFTGNINSSCFKPTLDFNSVTLLGVYAEGAGCSTAYHRNVSFDSTTTTYTYEVRVENCGGCQLQSASYNFVTIPKIKPGEHVVFSVK